MTVLRLLQLSQTRQANCNHLTKPQIRDDFDPAQDRHPIPQVRCYKAVRASDGRRKSIGESQRDEPLGKEVACCFPQAAKGRRVRPRGFRSKRIKSRRGGRLGNRETREEESGARLEQMRGDSDFGATRQDSGEQLFE